MTKKLVRIKSLNNISWQFFIRAYLKSSINNLEIIIKFLKENRIKEPVTVKDWDTEKTLNYQTYLILYRDLWFPTLYEIRHAIELILKSLSIKLDSSFLKTHNNNSLISEIKKSTKSKYLMGEDIRIIGKLTNKYHFYKFGTKSLINNQEFVDEENMLFRYPEIYWGVDLVRFDFNYFNSMRVSEAKKILSDAKKLMELTSRLESTPPYLEEMEKIGIPLKDAKKRIREVRKEKFKTTKK